jgi:hypothetical protein
MLVKRDPILIPKTLDAPKTVALIPEIEFLPP